MKLDDKEVCGEYGRRGGRNRLQRAKYLIEGEYVTMGEVARRLKISTKTARQRHRMAVAYHPKVTWELLSCANTK